MTDDLTHIIQCWHQGDASARDALYQFAYLQLRDIAQQERKKMDKKHGQENLLINEETYNTTSLIHEAYIKLEATDTSYINNRRQFYLMVSKIMRQVMFETARKQGAQKRQGSPDTEVLEDSNDLLHTSRLLEVFAEKYQRQAEVVQLKYFMGMNNTDIAEVMQCSQSLIEKDAKFARSWIKSRIA